MTNPVVIHSIIRFQNGVVMAFDASGEQMPEYQGNHKEVIERLRDVDLSQCRFEKGEWGRSLVQISQAEFFEMS